MLFKAVLECCVSGLVSIMAGGSLPSGRDRAGFSELSFRFGASTLQHLATHVRSGHYAQQGQFITRNYSESNDMSSSDHLTTDFVVLFHNVSVISFAVWETFYAVLFGSLLEGSQER